MPKIRQAAPLNSEVISAPLLHFKPIFHHPLKKNCKEGPPSRVGGALVKHGHSLARVKIWGHSTPLGPKYGLPKNALSVGLIPHLDLQGHRTELHRTCFA